MLQRLQALHRETAQRDVVHVLLDELGGVVGPAVEALGFAVSGIFAVSREPTLQLVEADCVFVRA